MYLVEWLSTIERVHVQWTAKHGNEIDLIAQLNVV